MFHPPKAAALYPLNFYGRHLSAFCGLRLIYTTTVRFLPYFTAATHIKNCDRSTLVVPPALVGDLPCLAEVWTTL